MIMQIYFEKNLIVAIMKIIMLIKKRINEIIIAKNLKVFELNVKYLPQCLQKMALSWIFSAQYGHFFIVNLLLAEYLLINVNIK